MIIGIEGFAGAGKDAVGQILIESAGFKRVAFADPLKEIAYAVNPRLFDYKTQASFRLAEQVEHRGWDAAKTRCPSIRVFLQDLGMALRDHLWPDVLVDTAFLKLVENDGPVVLTDVRYLNEIETIRMVGGEVWRVDRPGVGPANAHVSEHEWMETDPDQIIPNDGTLEGLSLKVQAAFLEANMRRLEGAKEELVKALTKLNDVAGGPVTVRVPVYQPDGV